MSTQPTNPETLLGEKPLGLAPSAVALNRALELVQNALHQPPVEASPTTADLAGAARGLLDHYAGGPDEPIREPGDDAPTWSDIYTPDELSDALGRHSTRIARLGVYDVATDLGLAAQAIDEQEAQIERLSKQIQQLAAEKVVAQNWIANLRQTNELYAATIAEQNAKLAETGK